VSYQDAPEDPEEIRINRLLDEISMVDPCLGSQNEQPFSGANTAWTSTASAAKTPPEDGSRSDLGQAAHQNFRTPATANIPACSGI
jgi:hypothetical protein